LRSSKTLERLGRVANAGLVLAGVGLFVFQMNGYLGGDDHHADPAAEEAAGHGHDQGTAGSDHHAPATKPPAQDAEPSPAQPLPETTLGAKAAKAKHGHKHGGATKKSGTKKHSHGHSHGSGKKHSH
jgi:hypothetical protein